MSKRKLPHKITVAKRNLFGKHMWWATCACRVWYQGCHYKQDAQRLAVEHIERSVNAEASRT